MYRLLDIFARVISERLSAGPGTRDALQAGVFCLQTFARKCSKTVAVSALSCLLRSSSGSAAESATATASGGSTLGRSSSRSSQIWTTRGPTHRPAGAASVEASDRQLASELCLCFTLATQRRFAMSRLASSSAAQASIKLWFGKRSWQLTFRTPSGWLPKRVSALKSPYALMASKLDDPENTLFPVMRQQ